MQAVRGVLGLSYSLLHLIIGSQSPHVQPMEAHIGEVQTVQLSSGALCGRTARTGPGMALCDEAGILA
jgi:hypothetical protein